MRQHLNNNGGALLIVLSIMLLLSMAAMMAVDTAQRDIDLSFNNLHYDQAFYAAEAGIRQVIYELNLDNAYNTSLVDVPFEEGSYWVVVIHSDIDNPRFDSVQLRATARVQDGCANIDALVLPELLYPFDFAVFGDEFVFMDQNTCTGSYDSEIDPDPAVYDNIDGDVASNGTVALDNSALVGGDASSVIDTGVTVCATCSVSGDVNNGVEPIPLDPIPEAPADCYTIPDGITGTYSIVADTLKVASNSTIRLAPGNYELHNILMQENSILYIDPLVTIYMDGALLLSNNTSVNPDQTPADLLIYSTGSIETLGNDVDIHAAFYGPDADVYLANSCDFYGSIISNSVTMENTGCIYYDRALQEVPAWTTGNMMMASWIER